MFKVNIKNCRLSVDLRKNVRFKPPRKHKKTAGFLILFVGIKKKHRPGVVHYIEGVKK